MEKNQIVILDDRGLIAVEGLEAEDFLQNMISNDIKKVSESNSIFSGIFTPQGKYLYEFFILKNKTGYLLDCDVNFKDELIEHLQKFKLRSKIDIKDLSSSHVIGAINREKFNEIQEEVKSNKQTIIYRESPCFLDSRLDLLGARILSTLEKLHLTIKKLNLKIIDKTNYIKLAHNHGVPIEGLKYLQNNLFGLECNLEEINGIDFKKGCYIGQENTARMRLKNKLRRRLMPISTDSHLNISDEITFDNQVVGKVLIDGKYPFALFKLFDPNFNQFSNANLKAGQADIKILIPSQLNI